MVSTRTGARGVDRARAGKRSGWQTLDSLQLLLIAAAGLIVIIAVTEVAAAGLTGPPGTAALLIAAMIRAEAVRARLGIALSDEMRAKLPLCAATGATGMLIAVSTWVMGLTALLVFTAPILVTQFAFRRFAGIRATYLQTVRALS